MTSAIWQSAAEGAQKGSPRRPRFYVHLGVVVVTISLGAVTAIPDHAGLTAADLTRSADELLYVAKDQGRNRALHHTLDTASESTSTLAHG